MVRAPKIAKIRAVLMTVLLCLFFAHQPPAQAATPPVDVQIIGNRQISEEVLRAELGAVHGADPDVARWLDLALLHLEEFYLDRKYVYARFFSKIQKDGSILIEIDEGKMHQVVFVGAGLLRGFMLQVDFDLPGKIYQQDHVDAALEKLQKKFRIYQIEERVDESKHNRRPTRSGTLAPERTLQIFVRGKESFGWTWGLTVDAQTGITPHVRFNVADKFAKDDRVYGESGFGLPYREFLFNEAPRFQWTHGRALLGYRSSPFWDKSVALGVQGGVSSTRFTVGSDQMESFVSLESEVLAGISWLLGDSLRLTPWLGIEFDSVPHVVMEAPDIPEPSTLSRTRGIARLEFHLELGGDLQRKDLRNWLDLNLEGALGGKDRDELAFEAVLTTQWVFPFGRNRLILRGRALAMWGDLRFWDEEPLAGSYLRVFFDNKFRVRRAAQFQSEFRINLWKGMIKTGLFADASVFGDERVQGAPMRTALAAGPSLHFMLYGFLACDFYYGFGHDEEEWSHNIAFWVGSAF